MRLPTPLLHRKRNSHKKDYGHVLILAGSQRMLGAAALTGLACMRAGAGLTTIGAPKSLNLTLQKKISNVIMTWPLPETKEQTLDIKAFNEIQKSYKKFHAIAIGPGLSQNENTQKLILKIIETSSVPLVIDADALNALAGHLNILKKTKTPKILTPHSGEFSRLINRKFTDKERRGLALKFAHDHDCVLLLKGHQTVVASPDGRIYINRTGNPGMATAGSGDVLTGMITAFLAQGFSAFDAAKFGAYLHGKAGDSAAKKIGEISLIASDIINHL